MKKEDKEKEIIDAKNAQYSAHKKSVEKSIIELQHVLPDFVLNPVKYPSWKDIAMIANLDSQLEDVLLSISEL